jgi:hypothetical protein
MKPNRSRSTAPRFFPLAVLLALGGLGLYLSIAAPVPEGKPAAYPAWWFEREVISRTDPANASPVHPADYPPAADFTALNHGQLKQFATTAFDELQVHLPGGAGPAITALVQSWHVTEDDAFQLDAKGRRIPLVTEKTSNFAPVTHGQLKEVAHYFFDRLQAELYYPADQPYPWDAAGARSPADHAVANLGQAKNLFQFDLTTDTIGDGIPDWWKRAHGLPITRPGVAYELSAGGVVTNIAAFRNDLDPDDPAAPPASSLLSTDPAVVITMIGTPSLDMSASTLVEDQSPSRPSKIKNGDFQRNAEYHDDSGFLGDYRRWYCKQRTSQGWKAVGGYNDHTVSGNRADRMQYEVQQEIRDYKFPTGHAHADMLNQYCELDAHWERWLQEPCVTPHNVITDNLSKGYSDTSQISDHGIRQTVQLARGTYALLFDYRGRPNADSNKFKVWAEAEGPDPAVSTNFIAAKVADTNLWQRGLVTFNVSEGPTSLTQLPIVLNFDIPAEEADSYGVFIDNVILIPVEFITPAGDPVSASVDATAVPPDPDPLHVPDGANEFAFSDATAGVLTLKLKARVEGFSSMSTAEKAKYKFEVDGIGSSTFAWSSGYAGGVPTASGDILTAVATYTNLPANNSDFGKKKARITFSGTKIAEQEFEVFYKAKSNNHHGGNATYPNWFHYYKDNAGGGAFLYETTAGARSGSSSGGGDATIKIGDEAFDGDKYITTALVGGLLKATGWSATHKYYANFLGVLAHERQHANGEVPQGGAGDPDSDWLSTVFETGTSHTDPANPLSASSGVTGFAGWTDDEIYAGGPVEQNGFTNADTSHDWANPGTNHKP